MSTRSDVAVTDSSAPAQFSLNAEQREIRDLALSFAAEQIAPHAIEWDQEKHFPRDVIRSPRPSSASVASASQKT